MLQLDNINCGYGSFHAVHDLSLSMDRGQVLALIGPNGAGKSSTIMSIAGHVNVFSGRITFGGEDITALPARERVSRGIALAPEGRRLFPDLTVRENLTVGGFTRPKSRETANRDKVLGLFPRLGERIGQRAGSLSGGEQQMLAIGRALMAEPQFLMIDEVSLGLMPKAVDICYEAIAALRAEGITILLVEQNTDRAVESADKVCVMESGRLVWQGDAEAARQDPGMIDAFLGLKEEDAA